MHLVDVHLLNLGLGLILSLLLRRGLLRSLGGDLGLRFGLIEDSIACVDNVLSSPVDLSRSDNRVNILGLL